MYTNIYSSSIHNCSKLWKQPNFKYMDNKWIPAAKSFQSCPILCNSIDGSPLGFFVPGILQARILEWVAISFSIA